MRKSDLLNISVLKHFVSVFEIECLKSRLALTSLFCLSLLSYMDNRCVPLSWPGSVSSILNKEYSDNSIKLLVFSLLMIILLRYLTEFPFLVSLKKMFLDYICSTWFSSWQSLVSVLVGSNIDCLPYSSLIQPTSQNT